MATRPQCKVRPAPEDVASLNRIRAKFKRSPSGIASELLHLAAQVGPEGYMDFLRGAYHLAEQIETEIRRKTG